MYLHSCILLSGSLPHPCTYIPCVPCISLHFIPFSVFQCMVSCVGPHYSHAPTFPTWIQFPAHMVTFLHKWHSTHQNVLTFSSFPCVVPRMGHHHSQIPTLCGFNSLCGWPFHNKGTVPTTMSLNSLHSLHGFISLHGCTFCPHHHVPTFPVWFPSTNQKSAKSILFFLYGQL